jgi:hypothetical protein
MPNTAFGLPRRSNSSRERCAQRSDRRIDAAASSIVAGRPSISYGVHSSNCMTTSEFSERWMRIDSSGVSISFEPSIGDAKRTPSSEIFRSLPRLQTWNPPESVRIGFDHRLKPCSPPNRSKTAVPGRSQRWKVLPRMICAPTSSRSRGAIVFTVP